MTLEQAYKMRREENIALLRENERLKKQLEKKLNTNFENSSLPSSALPFRKKITNSRKPSGKKPGAQHGHQGHSAERLLTMKEPVYIPAPESCWDDPMENTDAMTVGWYSKPSGFLVT